MAKKTSPSSSTASDKEVDTVASSNIIGADDGSEFLFTYDSNVEEAKAPEPLPVMVSPWCSSLLLWATTARGCGT
jgi:hypothetical protein